MCSECLLDHHYICKCVCMCNAETKIGYKNNWKLDNGSVKEAWVYCIFSHTARMDYT